MTKTKNRGIPFAIATKGGNVLRYEVLNRYAFKEDTKSKSHDEKKESKSPKGLVQPIFDLDALIGVAEVNTWHARAVEVKSIDTAGVGWGIMPVKDKENPSEEERKKLVEFFSTENLGEPLEMILTRVMNDYESIAIGDIEVVRDEEGMPLTMKHVLAHTIRAHSSRTKFAQEINLQHVWFKRFGEEQDIDCETGESLAEGSENKATELIHFTKYNPKSDVYGRPDSLPALGAVEGLLSLRDYNLKFFDNFGIPSYAIYITGDYNLGEKKDATGKVESDPGYDATTGEFEVITIIKDHLLEIQQNPHAPLILAIPAATPDGKVEITFKPLAVEVKEASFRLFKKDSKDEILVAHGVPAYRVGLTETGTLGGNVAKEATEIYRVSVIKPKKKLLEAIINKFIVREGFEIQDWQFFLDDLDTRDEEHEKEMADFMFARGAISPNEIREHFGKPFGFGKIDGEPGMDWHYINNVAIETGDIIREEITESMKSLSDDIREMIRKG